MLKSNHSLRSVSRPMREARNVSNQNEIRQHRFFFKSSIHFLRPPYIFKVLCAFFKSSVHFLSPPYIFLSPLTVSAMKPPAQQAPLTTLLLLRPCMEPKRSLKKHSPKQVYICWMIMSRFLWQPPFLKFG